MIKAPRGTRDLLPPDTALWNFVEDTVRDVFRAYNFQEIRTPIFEATELFSRSVGEETDIVSKEMFTWEDRGGSRSDRYERFLDEIDQKWESDWHQSVSRKDWENTVARISAIADESGSWKGQSLTLRPENTAGIVRAYIEHKL